MIVSDENIAQYHKEGFFIVELAISDAALAGLRAECQRYIDKFDAEMEAKGLDKLGINH